MTEEDASQRFAWSWQPAPGWPEPPPGWAPPPGWLPPPHWPPAPRDWLFWKLEPIAEKPPVLDVRIAPTTRRSLVWETRWVLAAFLIPTVTGAIVPLVQHAEGVTDINRFPTFVHNQPLTNMLLGILGYLGIGAVVPITLFLLTRTGHTARSLGLGWPRWSLDIWPGIGLALLSYLSEIAVLIPFTPLISNERKYVNQPVIAHVPPYYVIYGLTISAVTAITEEVVINGYLLLRLEELGWRPGRALLLSLLLRSSYHIYYGVAVLLIIPFGYFVTRSFQRHRRLNRPIAAHFIYDATLITISVLTS